jgi:predicted TPR repeat methyltransferase
MNRKQRRAGRTSGQAPSGTEDAIALHAQGVEAFRAGHPDKAATLIARAIAADGRMPDFHYNLAIVLRAQGKLEAAAASYINAIALKPDYGDAHNNLGNVWKALGDQDKARASFRRALAYKPGNPDTHYNLGILCTDAGERDEAVRHFQHCLDCDPEDTRGARILLAHLGAAGAPPRTPPAHLLKLYDVRAQFWDGESYFGAGLVTEGLRAHASRDGMDILDIGCGTGLVGAKVRSLAARLDGVDLSPAMLEKARGKALYDGLYQADIVSFMAEHKGRYDAILGAAILIHFGSLQEIFAAAAICLRSKGLFVFTLFPNEADDFAAASNTRLAQSGCFGHSPDYIRRLAADCGFSVETLNDAVHEHDQDGNAIPGLLAVLRAA